MKKKYTKMPASDMAAADLSYINNNLHNCENQWFALNKATNICITDIKGKIIYVNDSFCKLSKYTSGELIGQNHDIINSNYHDKYFSHELWKTILRGAVWEGQIRNEAKDGAYYWAQTTIVPFISELGKIEQFVSIKFDITTQKRFELSMEEKVHQRTKTLPSHNERQKDTVTRINKQNVYLKQVLEVMSYDLKSPNASIQDLTYLINRTIGTDVKVKSLMNKINGVTDQIGARIEELMEITKVLQEGTTKLENVNLEELFFKVKTNLAGFIMLTNARISYDFSQCPIISYNKSFMERIILNLLSNAIKYRKPDIAPIIHISTSMNKGCMKLQVTDNGMSIYVKKYKDKIFGLHETLHNFENSRGYGLYLIRSQVEVMGGSISVDSQVSRGSTFKINLLGELITDTV